MAVNIGRFQFEGPFTNTNNLKNQSGVYAILDCGNQINVIDIGESRTVKGRVENHDRKSCWQNNCSQKMGVAVLYASEGNRMQIEKELRRQFNPPCGDR